MSELTSAVREAQADADRRFGDGPVQPWEPPPVLGPATRRRLAIAAMASLLATALLVAMAVARTTPPAAQPAPADASEPVLPLLPDEEPLERDDEPGPRPGETMVAARLSLERDGAEWHLSATDASRLEVAQRLAEASGSSLRGTPDALRGIRPLQLQWQGRSLAQLWPLVLGPELNFALQCRRERCEVWILGPASSTSSPVASANPPSLTVEPPSLAMPMPVPMADDDLAPGRD